MYEIEVQCIWNKINKQTKYKSYAVWIDFKTCQIKMIILFKNKESLSYARIFQTR